jgi:hypothetical protein
MRVHGPASDVKAASLGLRLMGLAHVYGREGGEWVAPESLADMRNMLAEDFERKAEWREAKAAEYPEDDRNERAAKGLRELAVYVRKLTDDDPSLLAIDAVISDGNFDVTSPDTTLTRYGFGPGSARGLPDPDEFFSQYAEEWSRQLEIESVYRDDPERIRRLIAEDESASDVVAVAHRRESVAMFRRLLDDPEFFNGLIPPGRGKEAVWQKFLEDNRWILGGSLAGQFLAP